jgi:hypothetical protein
MTDDEDQLNIFIRQCDKLLIEIQDQTRPLKHRKGFGKHAAIEIVWAIGKMMREVEARGAKQYRGHAPRRHSPSDYEAGYGGGARYGTDNAR